MIILLNEIANSQYKPNYQEERKGAVKHSLAAIQKATENLGYKPEVQFKEGLNRVLNWCFSRKISNTTE